MSNTTAEHAAPRDYVLPDRFYDLIKPLLIIVAPAVSALYLVLGNAWDWYKPEAVAATITSVATFVGILLTLASRQYVKSDTKYDGVVTLEEQEDGTTALDLTGLPSPVELSTKDSVLLKVA